jgi:hypothetical protein
LSADKPADIGNCVIPQVFVLKSRLLLQLP